MARSTKTSTKEKSDKDQYTTPIPDDFEQLSDTTVINDDVVAVIAYMAVKEITGVVAMGGGLVGDIVEKFGKRSLDKGIKVHTKGENVVIDIAIFIDFGVRIPDIAVQIQNNVRKSVEEMAGKKVVAINLMVQGVKINSSDSKDAFIA